MNTKPYPYQRDGVEMIHAFGGRSILADEMGLGKSLQVLLYRKKYRPRGPCVIVCPASLKWNWQAEALKHLGMRAEVLETNKPPRKFGQGMVKDGVYVLNYEILGGWLPVLRKMKPALLVADEAHYLKSPGTKRTKNFRKLAEHVEQVILVTGTPMTNRPAELWPLLNVVRPDVFKSFMPFARRYCDPRWKPWGWEFKGAKNLDKLHRRLKKACMVRRLKSDVMKDLPAKSNVVIPVKLPPKAWAEYAAAEKDFIAWLRKTHPKRAASARKAERLVRYGYLRRLAAKLKLPQVKEWVDNFLAESGNKLLVFGVQRKVVKGLQQQYGDDKAARVDGSVSLRLRQGEFDRFNHDKHVRLFFGNIAAAGTGWSCTSASDVLFAELDWVPGNHTQAVDRVHGVGRGVKGRPVTAYWVIAKNTIEEKLLKVLQAKQRDVTAGLDGKASAAMDVYDALEQMYLNDKGGF